MGDGSDEDRGGGARPAPGAKASAALVLAFLLGAIPVGPAPASAALGAPAPEDTASGRSMTDADVEDRLRAAAYVERGLRYLASVQSEDRSFSAEPGEQVARAPLAVTALATLAFMAGGSTMGRGPYQQQVRDGVRYLMSQMVEKPPPAGLADGEVMPRYFFVESDSTSRMHGHGYATLALAQAYGTLAPDRTYRGAAQDKAREDRQRMRDALVAAVRLIEEGGSKAGQNADGERMVGWFYDPYDGMHEGSVTITMIQALRAARNVGVNVDKSVIDAAVRYVHESQSKTTGAFAYQLNDPRTSWALTAAAVATLNASGDYDSQTIDRAVDYMVANDPVMNRFSVRRAQESMFPYYGRLYAAQAYYVYRDPSLWERWRKALLDDLEARQDPDSGAFRNDEYGKAYATAVACLVLQIPYQYLPIFQK